VALRIVWGVTRKKPRHTEVEMKGITNLLAMVSVIASIGNIGGKAYEDGKLDASDLPGALVDGALIVPSLIQIQWNELIPEGKDLTAEEQSQLIAAYKQRFDIPQDNLEVTIEDVLEDVALLVSLVKRNIDRIQRIKNPAVAQGEPVNMGQAEVISEA